MQLLFVPVTGNTEDQVEKERKYAACKAHVARNAHRKRQQQVKDAQHWLSPVLVHGIHSDMDLLSFQIIPGKPSLDELVSHVRFYHRASWSSINMPDLQLGPPSGRTLSRRGISCEVTVPDRLWGFFFASAGTFASVLASIISIIRHATTRDISELERLSLQLKARSLLQLRQTIRNLPSTFVPSLALIYHVKALFREASLDGDLDGAKAHSKMLVWLTGKLPFDGDFAVDLCRLALWSDAIPALLQLRRPVMEYRHWLPRLVDSISTPAESGFTFPSHCDETLPSCISSQPLRAAFVHAHQALGIQKACRENRLRYTEDVFQWMVARAECHICSLLNLYFDLQDSSAAIELKQAERHCEAALALSLLHVYQKCFSNIRGPRPYDMDMHESAGINLSGRGFSPSICPGRSI